MGAHLSQASTKWKCCLSPLPDSLQVLPPQWAFLGQDSMMLWGKNPPSPTSTASLGISISCTLSPVFCSLAGGQPPGKGWHGSLAPAVPLGLPRLPQPRSVHAPAWHVAGTNFGPKGFPSADSAARVVLKTILARVFLPRLPAIRSQVGVFVLCVHVCVYLQTATNISYSFSFFPFFFFPFQALGCGI